MSGNGPSKVTPIVVVQGAQYGSEAKGMVAAHLCKTRSIKYAVRTGCINAGHTVYHNGRAYAMQQLPTGWVCPSTMMVLGPGAYIHPQTLVREVKMVAGALGCREQAVWDRIIIDYRAGLHTEADMEASAASGSHVRIGATGKGCSHAIMGRIKNRGTAEGLLFRDYWAADGENFVMPTLVDTVAWLNKAYDTGHSILLEGTQGTGLDLLLGPYPYTTHKPCQASQWIVEAGLSPALEYEVVLVARTMPIRVAGNSGPMQGETNWVTMLQSLRGGTGPVGFESNAPFIQMEAILNFKNALVHQYGPDALRQAAMVGEERVYRMDLLSKANMQALKSLSTADQEALCRIMELTTVTRKPRRIGLWDRELVDHAVMVNRPKWMALTFLNYLYPDVWNKGRHQVSSQRMHEIMQGVGKIQHPQCPIKLMTTGPEVVWEGEMLS